MDTMTATPLTAGQKAAATRRANIARMADQGGENAGSPMGRTGLVFELGKTCVTCFVPQVAFPENQLPKTSPRYPQCSQCLDYERRIIARGQAS